MYLEIPIKEVTLLTRADSLGFKENPEDIKIDGVTYTYVLSKMIGSK